LRRYCWYINIFEMKIKKKERRIEGRKKEEGDEGRGREV
jgi:hypothetical protein